MIASVAFRNFKALRSTSLRLSPFNLVIGPTGSGKSSLIQAVLRLRSAARSGQGKPGQGGLPLIGGPSVTFRFTSPNEAVEAEIFHQAGRAGDSLRVASESPAAWEEVKAGLGRARAFLFDHEAMALPAPRSQGSELAANGANLAAVLAHRRESDPKAYARLEAEALRLLPEFTGLMLRDAPGGTVELAGDFGEGEGSVSAENLAQGSLYTLALLTLVSDPSPPSIVCIEEIDRGIHPRMLREIRDALYRLSYPEQFGEPHPPVQVIATGYSPYLLDLFRDHPDEVVIAQKEGREARFEHLSDRGDLAKLLREGSLGDLWYSGILGGVPEEKHPR